MAELDFTTEEAEIVARNMQRNPNEPLKDIPSWAHNAEAYLKAYQNNPELLQNVLARLHIKE